MVQVAAVTRRPPPCPSPTGWEKRGRNVVRGVTQGGALPSLAMSRYASPFQGLWESKGGGGLGAGPTGGPVKGTGLVGLVRHPAAHSFSTGPGPLGVVRRGGGAGARNVQALGVSRFLAGLRDAPARPSGDRGSRDASTPGYRLATLRVASLLGGAGGAEVWERISNFSFPCARQEDLVTFASFRPTAWLIGVTGRHHQTPPEACSAP
jgi:hypothetical protein